MKLLGILSIIITLTACSSNHTSDSPNTNLDWMLGSWKLTNGELGTDTYETWTKTAEGYSGHAFALIKDDTIFQEHIETYFSEGKWHYKVSGPNDHPIVFSSTSLTDSSVVCENPEHDFPKVVSYKTVDGCLSANISDGAERNFEFRFEKTF